MKMRAMVMAAWALASMPAASADAVELNEQVRREVARQLEALRQGKSDPGRVAPAGALAIDPELLAELVRKEIASQLLALEGGRATPAEPLAAEAVAAEEDWYYIPQGDELPAPEPDDAMLMLDGVPVAVAPDALASVAGVAPADNPVRQSNNAVEFVTALGSTQATITLSTKDQVVSAPTSAWLKEQSYKFVVSAPVDKKTEESTFASLAGFANGFNIIGGWQLKSSPKVASGDDTPWSRVYALRGLLGYDDFAYYTSLTNKETDRETRWSIGGSFGLSSPDRQWYWGLGADIQHGHRALPSRIVCPLSTTETFDCVQGSFGPPIDGYTRIGFVEMRSQVAARPFSLRIGRDFTADRTTADLPIYLLRDKDSKFIGGVRFGWASDDDFLAGVFVGKEFVIP